MDCYKSFWYQFVVDTCRQNQFRGAYKVSLEEQSRCCCAAGEGLLCGAGEGFCAARREKEGIELAEV